MSASFSTLTIQDIADSISIKLANQDIINYIDRDCEKFIRQIITQANAFCASTRSYKLSPVHIDMVLESMNLPPLLGYDSSPTYMANPLNIDQADLYGIKENMCPLRSIVDEPVFQMSNNITHQLRWTLVEGVYIGKRSSSRDRSSKQNRENKSIERSVSVPNVSSLPHSEITRNTSTSNTGNQFPLSSAENTEKYSQSDSKKCADDILSNEHQQYFISTIKLLRNDTVNTLDCSLKKISEEDKLHTLLPYFLQYITGKMTLEFNNVKSMKVLIRFTLALLQNKSMNIPLYAHPFLRIVFSALLSSNVSSSDTSSSYTIYDADIRRYAAEALSVLVYRCESCFCDMKEVIFNSLAQSLFNPDTSLNAHYGAILGMKEIGFIGYALPHLKSYLRLIKFELGSTFNFQSEAAESVLKLIETTMYEFSMKSDDQDEKELADSIVNDIRRIKKLEGPY